MGICRGEDMARLRGLSESEREDLLILISKCRAFNLQEEKHRVAFAGLLEEAGYRRWLVVETDDKDVRIDASTADQCIQALNLAVNVMESLSGETLARSFIGDPIMKALENLKIAIDVAENASEESEWERIVESGKWFAAQANEEG